MSTDAAAQPADPAELVQLIAEFTAEGNIEMATVATGQLRDRLNQLIDARIAAALAQQGRPRVQT